MPIDWRRVGRRAAPNAFVGLVAPSLVFYGVFWAAGIWTAIFSMTGFTLIAAIISGIWTRYTPASLLLTPISSSTKILAAWWGHNPKLFFLQPLATTSLIACLFLVTAIFNRPYISRLATDFIPPDLLTPHWVPHFFRRCSILWGATLAATVAASVFCWFTMPVTTYAIIHSAIVVGLYTISIVVSVSWFARLYMRHKHAGEPVIPSAADTAAIPSVVS